MSTFNPGEIITIEAELKKYTPFGSHALTDADSLPTITIKDKADDTVVDAASMVNSATGKYYYECVSATTWIKGEYEVTIIAIYGGKTNTHVKEAAFILT